ncbi:MAG: type II toxin-antitoxin system PemK/MazF family toxin [Micrococcales bacterium]|nr:type II toxin-antitoxin system PemK/MazF family toxin [Micrococcales bacterium]MCL2666730.1 type II toxin-antitoxin system PemK/MazF family toxin [Micrococcales bacterium]
MAYVRGQVFWADIGAGRKPYLVVSNNARNRNLGSALVVRVTTTPKPQLASIVELDHADPLVGRVLCDDITVLYPDDHTEPAGALSVATMRRVDSALRVALALA